MKWTGWDIAIVAAFVLQLSAAGFLFYAAREIKNGPVSKLFGKVGGISRSGKALAEFGAATVAQNKVRVLSVVGNVRQITAAVHPGRFTREDLPINYRTLFTAFATLRTTLGYQRQLGSLFQTRKTPPPGPPTRGKDRDANSLLDRLGLIPPAAKQLSRAVPVARFLFEFWKQLKQRSRE